MGLVAASLALLHSTASFAQESEPEDTSHWAEAAELFDSGRALMQQAGSLDHACEVLTKSYELRRRGDTLLNLAECHRRQGKTATAWREFDEAIKYAKEVEFAEAIEAAVKLRDDLAKNLSGLMVDVPADPPPPTGLEVVLDGKPLPPAQWGQPLYVDPGVHTVHATAKGYEVLDDSVDVKSGGDRAVLEVVLKAIPTKPVPPPAKPPPPKPAPEPAQEAEVPVWAIVVGSAGLAMVGVGIGFGVDNLAVGSELDDECGPDRRACPSQGYDFKGARAHELRSFGVYVGVGAAGVIATAIGAVGLGIGLSSGDAKAPVAFTPWASPEGGGVAITGALW